MPESNNKEDAQNRTSSTGEEPSLILFKKYEIGRLLGCGAFAKVYHARNMRSGQSVAIKSISKQRIIKGNFVEHVKREISIMRELDHPHIVHLHEVLATKSKIYFVMEFVKGGELFNKINKGRFSEDLSRKYFQQLISTIGYCHSRGIFHRDLKLENLLLDENWELKVTDFGLSAVTGQIRSDGFLHTLCGTPAYVAPEILAKKGYHGANIDVWSCGIILYALNAGYLPFNDTNLMAMYRKIYRGEFRCPKWTSPELKRLLNRILDPNPNTRITVNEIMEDPWFKKGYKEIDYHPVQKEFEFKEKRFLNAFDLISFSSGSNLSGLFSNNNNNVNRISHDMFVSAELPERIINRIVELGEEEEGVRVVKKEIGVRLELEGQNGNSVVMVEINRLTEILVVVDVKRSGFGLELWEDKFKPRLIDLVHQPEELVDGD